jgi:hypothetical protein
MIATLDGAPRLQRSWDSRAAWNFIGGGAGTGLLLAAAAALPAGWPYFPAGALGIALIGFGLSMVWLEIGRPFRALNVFFHPQTSWMSREALLALPLLTLAGIATLADQSFVSLPLQRHLPVTPLASAAAALGLAFLYCQARILRASHGVPAWREPSLQSVIMVTEPTSPEARAAIESIIKDSYAWFRGMVQDRRHLNDDELQTVADGRVFTGHQAIGLKLVDEIGDERAGIAWLASEKKIDAKLPVRDYQLHGRFSDLPFLHAAAAAVLDAAGLATLARGIDDLGAMQAVERLNLDGLLALWHPASAN